MQTSHSVKMEYLSSCIYSGEVSIIPLKFYNEKSLTIIIKTGISKQVVYTCTKLSYLYYLDSLLYPTTEQMYVVVLFMLLTHSSNFHVQDIIYIKFIYPKEILPLNQIMQNNVVEGPLLR